jgi:hypothetical protein
MTKRQEKQLALLRVQFRDQPLSWHENSAGKLVVCTAEKTYLIDPAGVIKRIKGSSIYARFS